MKYTSILLSTAVVLIVRASAAQDARRDRGSADGGRYVETSKTTITSHIADAVKGGISHVMRTRHRAAVAQSCARFFERTELDQNTRDRLVELLLDKEVGVWAGQIRVNDATPADGFSAAAEVQSQYDAIDAQIAELLGEPHYAAFKQYEKTRHCRTTVQKFAQKLPAKHQLSGDQEDKLVNIFCDELTTLKTQVTTSADLYAGTLNQFAARLNEVLNDEQYPDYRNAVDAERRLSTMIEKSVRVNRYSDGGGSTSK